MTSIGKAIFTVAVLFWALYPALGQDPVAPVGPAVVDVQSPERWIRQLGHETMAKREEAERVLEQIGDPAIPALEKAIANSDQRAFRDRCRRVLEEVRRNNLFARVEASNGLKLAIECSEKRLAHFETAVAKCLLRNVSDRPINVEVGCSLWGNSFECALGVKAVLIKEGREKSAERFSTKGYIGANAKTLTQLLMPGQTVAYRMEVSFLEKSFKVPGVGLLDKGFSFSDAPESVADVLAVGNSLSSFVSLDGAESVRLAVEHSVKGQEAEIAEGKSEVDAVWWNGSLKSNSITLQIDRSVNKDAGTAVD